MNEESESIAETECTNSYHAVARKIVREELSHIFYEMATMPKNLELSEMFAYISGRFSNEQLRRS